ncbi:hypothetical protein GQX73_g10167 [Xylaria multiplex]|uniref:Uncharacterized protein n=1 Tax=Xylaria multiplex TaxID=323545 RepID=A0A7C8ILI3_9PEZI|nr:hypothetical protein GQX73_g10167 [Xylaria multiplex]
MVADLVTKNLKRKASRWQTRPPLGGEDSKDVEVDGTRYSVLLFIRDMVVDPQSWAQFIEGLQNAPGVIDETSVLAAMLEAAQNTQLVQHDYINLDEPNKRRRIDLYANPEATEQINEYDELINLARTVWTNPDNLASNLSKVMTDIYQTNLGQQPGDPNYTLEKIFSMARSWAEVRYRFCNHALRDDPYQHAAYNTGRPLAKGNAANSIVHESNVLLDAVVTQFLPIGGLGYGPADRDIFHELYLLTAEQGKQLARYTGSGTGLRIGLPQVFDYCVFFINAYMNWRVKVLESARKMALSSQAHRNAHTQAEKIRIMEEAHRASGTRIQAVDNSYTLEFVPALVELLDEARTQNSFVRATFIRLENSVNQMTRLIKICPANTATNDLRHNAYFNRSVNGFPGQGRTLPRPTGTSMVAHRAAEN